jgi:hypothetical protein
VKFEYFLQHAYGTKLNRRQAMRHAAKMGGAAGTLALLGSAALHDQLVDQVRASTRELTIHPFDASALQPEPIDDTLPDFAAVEAGAWAPGPYGPDDQRGAFNEVTPLKTASALRLLDTSRPVVTYNLGELMFNGFPAFRTDPPRLYEHRLTASGYTPRPNTGVILGSSAATAPNRISAHEERFVGGTYQIGTQLDNLNHVGVGNMFYNGNRGSEIAEPWGTNRLGGENMGPIVTRGVLLDIVGLKVSQGATGDFFTAGNGSPVLRDNYRVTLEDIEAAMQRQGIREIGPGDVVQMRFGWTHLVTSDPNRYLASEPGIWLRECRWFAQRRVAIVGSDAWGLECIDPAVTGGNAFSGHQLLFGRYGIRIHEGVVTDKLAEDGVFEFVFIVTPQYARGSTAGNTPPAALGQPRQ